MKDYFEFIQDGTVKTFCHTFGGGFGYVGSTCIFAYLAADGNKAYAPIEEESPDLMLEMVKESLRVGRNLIVERWRVLTHNPDCFY